MAQATFPFESTAAARRGRLSLAPPTGQSELHVDPTAFEIGWDFAHHRLTPPVTHLQAESPVHHGWRAGRAAFGLRTLRATLAVRRWLQLRLAAWVQGRVFESVQVTPQFLRQINVAECPVTREALTQDTGSGSDAVVARVFDGAGYAAGNLALISARAQQVLVQHRWDDALARARQIDIGRESGISGPCADESSRIDGLSAVEWQRLVTLMSFTTPLPHSVAANLPLCVLPPNRLRVINPVQALQVTLTLQFLQAGFARRLVALAALMPNSPARQAFQVFMHTLLARRLAAGPALDARSMRRAMEDTWGDALVNRRWQRLTRCLTAADCEQLLQRAAQRGLAGRGASWLSAERATEGWGIESGGWIQAGFQTPATRDGGVAAGVAPIPGIARSLGSQKPANCEAVIACGAFQ